MTSKNSTLDLSRWDFQKTFSAYEVACLIQGTDPLQDSTTLHEDDPVFMRVKHAYLYSLALLTGMPSKDPKRELMEGLCHAFLYKKRDHVLNGGEVPDGDIDLDSHPLTQLSSVRFERQEVARWLKQLKLQSIYAFQMEEMSPAQWQQVVIRTVERHGGNKSAAARELGISQQRVSELFNKKTTAKGSQKSGAGPSDFGAQALVNTWHKPLNSIKKK